MTDGHKPPTESTEPTEPTEPTESTGSPEKKPASAADDSAIQASVRAKAKDEKKSSLTAVLGTIMMVVFKPFVWLFRPLIFRVSSEKGNPKVHFTSFSPLLYIWPIMVVGFLGCLLDNFVRPELLGWAWITVVFLVLLSMGTDMDRNKAVGVMGVILICWLGGYVLNAEKGIPILSNIHAYLAEQHVVFEAGTAKVMSIATGLILLCVFVAAWFDGRYEITTREITHKRIFRTSDSLPRAAKRIKRDWRDITEVVLGLGAGDLIVLDTNKNIVMRVPNIPFLWFFRHDVDQILEVLATTDVDLSAALEEEDDFS